MATTALVSPKHKAFAIPFDQGIANLIPAAKSFSHPEHGSMLLVPHTRDTTRLARNMGYTTPAPILAQYNWNNDTPFKTQMTTAALATMHPRGYVLSEMGTGKTRAILHAINFLIATGEIRSALVAAPLSTLTSVWDMEVFKHFRHLTTSVLYGTKKQRLKALAFQAQIYIINHDGVETILPELLSKQEIDFVVIDELAAYRNATTDRWKAMNLLVNGGMKKGSALPLASKPFAWGLTGSPTPNEPADAWGQCRLLSPARVPVHFKQFKRQTMLQMSQFRWVPRHEANDIVFEAMQPAVRYKRDDCVELPETSYQDRQVPLSAEQSRVYKQLMQKLKIGFQEGTVTAANEGVLFSKLLQITTGWVYTTDKKVVALPNQERVDALLEVIDEASTKVIVFVDFTYAAGQLHEILTRNRIHSSLVTGEVPRNARDHIFNAFQNSYSPRVIVAHPRCMAHGLTLTAANTIVWFSPTTSLETYEQACARITRPGQTQKSLIVHLTGTPVETKLYRQLQRRAKTQGALLEMFESQEHET